MIELTPLNLVIGAGVALFIAFVFIYNIRKELK
jgi:hypothetical protein